MSRNIYTRKSSKSSHTQRQHLPMCMAYAIASGQEMITFKELECKELPHVPFERISTRVYLRCEHKSGVVTLKEVAMEPTRETIVRGHRQKQLSEAAIRYWEAQRKEHLK